ncbi:hypothetical protein J6590_029731 [Homalodisca vitripennis]|nr:hypothetical protein J6590_029731 [Homalodisca vitripennis]
MESFCNALHFCVSLRLDNAFKDIISRDNLHEKMSSSEFESRHGLYRLRAVFRVATVSLTKLGTSSAATHKSTATTA